MKKRYLFLMIIMVLTLLVACAPKTTNPNNTTPGTTKSNDVDLDAADPKTNPEPVKSNE